MNTSRNSKEIIAIYDLYSETVRNEKPFGGSSTASARNNLVTNLPTIDNICPKIGRELVAEYLVARCAILRSAILHIYVSIVVAIVVINISFYFHNTCH